MARSLKTSVKWYHLPCKMMMCKIVSIDCAGSQKMMSNEKAEMSNGSN